MRNIEDILDAAFIIMMLADRGLLERAMHEGRSYSIEEREDKRKLFMAALKSRELDSILSPKESEIINARVETLSDEAFYLTQMQYEAIPVLLWAVGLCVFPKYDAKLTDVDFHSILGKHRTEQTKVDRNILSLDITKIKWWRNVALLWHWRAREGVSNPAINGEDIVESVRRIFGKDYLIFFSNIPLSKKRPRDFMVDKRKFNELNPEKGGVLLIQAKWRHHALEWIVSDVPWDEVNTST